MDKVAVVFVVFTATFYHGLIPCKGQQKACSGVAPHCNHCNHCNLCMKPLVKRLYSIKNSLQALRKIAVNKESEI